MAEVTLTDEEPFVNNNDFNAIDRNRDCSLSRNRISVRSVESNAVVSSLKEHSKWALEND